MKRKTAGILGWMLAIAATILLLLFGLSNVFYPKDNVKSAGMFQEEANSILGERENSIDVLFIGDSEAYSSFSPLRMWERNGFTSCVCATDAQQLTYSNTLLHRATKNQRPRVVVFEANSAYNPFSAGDSISRTLSDVFPVFEFHNRWKNLKPSDFTEQPRATHTDRTKGFHIYARVKGTDASSHMAPSNEVEDISRLGKLYLKHMVNYCRSIGAEPVIVSAPSTACWSTKRHNGMQACAEELGVTYLDLNMEKQLGIDWALDTRDDGDHLNITGAEKVSDFIGDHLAETYDLPDHRKDAAYEKWNESLQDYKKLVEEKKAVKPHNGGQGGPQSHYG